MVDWVRRPYTTKGRIHDGPDAPVVDIVWYITDLPPISSEQQHVINSRGWDNQPWEVLDVGELPEEDAPRKYNGRWNRPAIPLGHHVCRQEWMADGEPWPNDLAPTEYIAENIPSCCVPAMPCETQECGRQPQNGEDAAQFSMYPIPAQQATEDTPQFQIVVAKKGDNVVDDTPQFQWIWRPQGIDDEPQFQWVYQSGPNPLFRFEEQQFQIAPNTNYQRRRDMNGETWDYEIDGVNFQLSITALAGKGVLTGTNVQLSPSVLPPQSLPTGWQDVVIHAASVQPVNPGVVRVRSFHGAGSILLPDIRGALVVVVANDAGLARAGFLVRPPAGQHIGTLGVNDPVVITWPGDYEVAHVFWHVGWEIHTFPGIRWLYTQFPF